MTDASLAQAGKRTRPCAPDRLGRTEASILESRVLAGGNRQIENSEIKPFRDQYVPS
jgi:hypothetical protein